MTASRTTSALAFAAVALAAGAAEAADLPVRTAPPPYVAPLPVFTWTGAYFGLNAGGTFDDEGRYRLSNGAGITAANTGIGSSRPTGARLSSDGFTGGAQLGYNYQLGSLGALGGFGGGGIVVGFEADAAYMDAAETRVIANNFSTAGLPATNSFRSGIDFLGTVRGRLGYAFNQFLVYGTGGFAYGDVFNRAALYTAGNAAQLRFSGSKGGIQTGYAYGGGVEYALPTGSFLNFFRSSAVTLKVEYLRYDLGEQSFPAAGRIPATAGLAYNLRTTAEGNLVRAGLNYKF